MNLQHYMDSTRAEAARSLGLNSNMLGRWVSEYRIDGGLTEALQLAKAAKEKGCKLMVGNMVGTSLAMAPSFVVAQLCDLVDIDGPLLLKYDRPLGLQYKQGVVRGFDPRLWG